MMFIFFSLQAVTITLDRTCRMLRLMYDSGKLENFFVISPTSFVTSGIVSFTISLARQKRMRVKRIFTSKKRFFDLNVRLRKNIIFDDITLNHANVTVCPTQVKFVNATHRYGMSNALPSNWFVSALIAIIHIKLNETHTPI